MRRSELLRAAAILGVGRVITGGRPDGALGAEDEDGMVADVVRSIRLVRPDVVVTFGPEGGPNRHRDHRVISRVTTTAFFVAGSATAYPNTPAAALPAWRPHRLFYFTWRERLARAFTAEGQPITCSLRVGDWLDAKRRAFEEHRSQWDHRERFELTLEEYEDFLLASGCGAADDDLFAGLG